jgi:hypothetical protein
MRNSRPTIDPSLRVAAVVVIHPRPGKGRRLTCARRVGVCRRRLLALPVVPRRRTGRRNEDLIGGAETAPRFILAAGARLAIFRQAEPDLPEAAACAAADDSDHIRPKIGIGSQEVPLDIGGRNDLGVEGIAKAIGNLDAVK